MGERRSERECPKMIRIQQSLRFTTSPRPSRQALRRLGIVSISRRMMSKSEFSHVCATAARNSATLCAFSFSVAFLRSSHIFSMGLKSALLAGQSISCGTCWVSHSMVTRAVGTRVVLLETPVLTIERLSMGQKVGFEQIDVFQMVDCACNNC